MGMKKTFFWFFIGVASFLGATAFFGKGSALLAFFRSDSYLFAVKAACVLAFVLLILKWAGRNLPPNLLKWIYGTLCLPLLLLPLFRCYFRVPYVFCRSCPSQCPWGIARTIAFSSFVLLNLSGKFWCSAMCPFGTFQECQPGMTKKSFRLPAWVLGLSYLALFAVTGMYLLTLFDLPWIAAFDLKRYEWVRGTVLTALLIIAASFYIPKFWCRYLCPVGTIAEFSETLFPRKK